MKRSFKHWTPRYVVDRILLKGYEARHADHPWLTRASIEILTSWLQPDDIGLELGSGRSTVWFARRVRKLVSVEHDPEWYKRVQGMIDDRQLRNVDYQFAKPESYAEIVDSLPNDSFDFILIDGIERDRCAVTCISKLRTGGLLIVDDAHWFLPFASRSPLSRGVAGTPATAAWDSFARLVRQWRVIWTTDGVTDTAIWIKP